MSNKYKVCDNLHRLWTCIWMSPYHDRAAPVFHAFARLCILSEFCRIPTEVGQMSPADTEWSRIKQRNVL